MKVFRVLVVWLVVGGLAIGQTPGRPLVCSGEKEAARPTPAEVAAVAAANTADPTVLIAAEPMENLGVARYRIEDYADCIVGAGCYWSDLEAQTGRAEAALQSALKSLKPGEKPALVLDIDETLLSNYCEERREDFGYIGSMFNAWVVSPAASMPIPGTLRLFLEARAAGVAVFFITGRPDEQRAATERNLMAAGYKGWAGLRLRVGDEKKMSTVTYKSSERRRIVDAGYRLVMSVGDQWSDLDGSPKAEVSVKLPNPFYYLP